MAAGNNQFAYELNVPYKKTPKRERTAKDLVMIDFYSNRINVTEAACKIQELENDKINSIQVSDGFVYINEQRFKAEFKNDVKSMLHAVEKF